MPGRCCSTAAGQPRGVRVLMPRPLSSQTSSSGQSRCTCVRYAAALRAPAAVEWLTEASPKLATTSASSGHGVSRPSSLREPQGEAEPDGARQVRGDRRRLRDDVQLRVPEHLVPAAGHRVRGRAGQAPERLADRVDAPVEVRAGGVERTRAVVQQRGVGGPRQQAEGGVRLVPGRADRVEAGASLLEPPRREVEVPALGLGLEERLEPADESAVDRVRLVRRAQAFDGAEEVLVDGLHGTRGWHRPGRSSDLATSPAPGAGEIAVSRRRRPRLASQRARR